MTDKTLYVRPDLAATRAGVPDPAALADLWLDRLRDLRETVGDGEPPAGDAYDALALWARVRRVRPELIELAGWAGDWPGLDGWVRARGPDLAAAALDVPNPGGWLAEAERLSTAVDEAASGRELAEWSERLLEDLDDADLVAWAAGHFGRPDPDLEEGLAGCTAWLRDHADLLLYCAVPVQTAGLALREDLTGFDPALAWTADKYVLALDALEEAERDLFAPEWPELDATTARELVGRFGYAEPPTPREADWAWLPPELQMAAATPGPRRVRTLRWRSPDGAFTATLAAGPTTGETFRVNFDRGDRPAEELAGQTAELGGVPAVIDAEGNADLAIADLRQAGRSGAPCVLRVGQNGGPWQQLAAEDAP